MKHKNLKEFLDKKLYKGDLVQWKSNFGIVTRKQPRRKLDHWRGTEISVVYWFKSKNYSWEHEWTVTKVTKV